MKRRIVVVGGGITGAFAAYFLARLGVRPILVERGEIGGQSSGNNPGGLNPLHGAGIPGPMQALALESFRLHLESWDALRELSGIEFAGQFASRIHLALDDADLARLKRAREPYDSNPGFSARWLEPADVLEIERRVNPRLLGGLLTEGNAKVDAHSYTRAVAESAVGLGAEIVAGEARGLARSGRHATHVLLRSGALDCDGVVIATGPWTHRPARWLETSIPLAPVKGELVLARATGGGVRCDFAWRDAAVYGAGNGEIWLGGTEDRAGFRHAPSAAARSRILARVSRAFSGMTGVRVVRQITGLRPVTPDDIPIVGPAPGWENVCLALGGGRKGMLLSTGMAMAAADLLVSGDASPAIAPCTPQRWTAPLEAQVANR